MTRQLDSTLPDSILETLLENGLSGLPEVLSTILNIAMQAERQSYLGLQPYERSSERQDYANGFKDKTVLSRVGQLKVAIPQVRSGEFYPSALEKGMRSERALIAVLGEIYIQGVSTRRVAAITEKLCGVEISSTQVSRAIAEMDQVLIAWRNRSLAAFPYLYLDARYESVRQEGSVNKAAVLIAVGVDEMGKRHVLGASVAFSEHEVHWREFLQSLVKRGLSGVQLITSDAHEGLKAACKTVFGGVPWQRCQFHLQQNAQAYVLRQEKKTEVGADIRAILQAANRQEAENLLVRTVEKYRKSMPKLADWMETNVPEGLTVFSFPDTHRRLIRTTNGLERLNKEVRRRTRVATLFPSEESCLRLVSAVLMEISEEWETGKAYLLFDK